MKNILIISGHPDLGTSVANATILNEVARALPEAEIRRLDSLYPDYRFDIAAEQNALRRADVIVFQFPFSWYSVPGLLKLRLDEVFLPGFAHGSTAELGGKKLLLSFTTGAPAAAYQKDGFFKHTIDDFLPPFATLATLCNLDFVAPIYTCGISYVGREDTAAINTQKDQARDHAARLIAKIREIAA